MGGERLFDAPQVDALTPRRWPFLNVNDVPTQRPLAEMQEF